MTEQILAALRQLDISVYQLEEDRAESLECFYIRKNLDLKRSTDVTEIRVTVYRDFEKDGKRMRGSSTVQIHPGMNAEEIRDALAGAYRVAALVSNPWYELPAGQKEEPVRSRSGLAERSLEENMRLITEALFAPDRYEDVFLNSAEVFVRKNFRHIVNSSGVDVAYEVYDLWGEYVVQCVEPQDVESYHQFSYRDMETEALKKDVEEALEMTRTRALAVSAPVSGTYTLLLSGQNVKTVLNYYLNRANTSMVYQKFSDYAEGAAVQGERIEGDALTIELKAKDPYSPEGIPMQDRLLMEKGVLRTLHGGARSGWYLGVRPTGTYRSIAVPVGETPLEQLKEGPCLHVVSFSDFQMNELTGHFGGEIRLAFLYENGTVTPLTGGSVNGSLMEVQGHMTFSKERYRSADYEGPFAVRIQGVNVAGA